MSHLNFFLLVLVEIVSIHMIITDNVILIIITVSLKRAADIGGLRAMGGTTHGTVGFCVELSSD